LMRVVVHIRVFWRANPLKEEVETQHGHTELIHGGKIGRHGTPRV